MVFSSEDPRKRLTPQFHNLPEKESTAEESGTRRGSRRPVPLSLATRKIREKVRFALLKKSFPQADTSWHNDCSTKGARMSCFFVGQLFRSTQTSKVL
jgi:hypothetical protein